MGKARLLNILFCLTLVLGLEGVTSLEAKNKQRKPYIGILSAPPDSGLSNITDSKSSALCISYIKLIENAGGLPVLLKYNESPKTLQKIFNQLDGLLLPGGRSLLFSQEANTVGSGKSDTSENKLTNKINGVLDGIFIKESRKHI